MKLRTRSWHITGFIPNSKLMKPEKDPPMTREDKIFSTFMILGFSYFMIRGMFF